MFSRRSSVVPNGSLGYEHSRQGACVERPLAKVCSLRSFKCYGFDSRLCLISLNSIVSFVNTYAAPVGISNASWRFYFLYLVVDAVGILVIYLTFVETRGRSLEEMDRVFDDPHPVRKSLQKQEIVVKETGNGELEVAYME